MLRDVAVRRASLALLVAGWAGTALADTPAGTHVTIRGSGTNIAIERTEAPARRPPSQKEGAAGDAIVEAARLKAGGADDASVVAYLRAHQSDLPPVVGAEDARRLRRAGAGRAVFDYLTTVAAVEIGETGEGREPAASSEAVAASDLEAPVYDVPSSYPYVGYAQPYPGLRRGFAPRRMIVPRRQRAPHAPSFLRSMPGRRRLIGE
jgi:hypothetical protein